MLVLVMMLVVVVPVVVVVTVAAEHLVEEAELGCRQGEERKES